MNQTLDCDSPMSTYVYNMIDDESPAPCAFCNGELSDKLHDKLNERLKTVTSSRPCCGSPLCLKRSVFFTKRPDGFVEKGTKPKKNVRQFKKRRVDPSV